MDNIDIKIEYTENETTVIMEREEPFLYVSYTTPLDSIRNIPEKELENFVGMIIELLK